MSTLSALGGPDPVDLHVGARLKALRISRRMSQSTLAAAVGVSFQQIQKYERGTNRISASMLYGIARRLAAPISALFEGLPDTELGDGAYRQETGGECWGELEASEGAAD